MHLHFVDSLLEVITLLPDFFILIEEVGGLRLEVIELVAQLPYLILCILLGYSLVQLLHDPLCLSTHILDLSLHQRKHLVLVVLQPAGNVLVHSVDDAVDSSEMGSNGLFRLCEGRTVALLPFD